MPYIAEKPQRSVPPSSVLRERIPGWGVDLDPKDRSAVPKEDFTLAETGAHWDFPERQPEEWPRERSIEHKFLTPVFGTSCPPRGLSGAMRKVAYSRWSEGQAAHWLMLMAADRVDVLEGAVEAVVKGRPDNPISETGIMGEFRGQGGIRSRIGQNRADLKHQPLDPLIVAAPWVVLGGAMFLFARSLPGRAHERELRHGEPERLG